MNEFNFKYCRDIRKFTKAELVSILLDHGLPLEELEPCGRYELSLKLASSLIALSFAKLLFLFDSSQSYFGVVEIAVRGHS